MATHDARDRLQPVLLDRLTDLAPTSRLEADDTRVMNKAQIRQAVLRDLAWLLNAVKPMGDLGEAYPQVADSVLNFGLPPMSGQLASRIDLNLLERTLRNAIVQLGIVAAILGLRGLAYRGPAGGGKG